MEKSAVSIKSRSFNLNHIKISKYIDFNTAMFMAMGFLLSRSMLIGSIAPLGIAFFLYVSKIDRYKIPVFISTLLGILLSANSMSYILKYSLCLIIFMVINKTIKQINSVWKIALIGAFVLLPISIGQALLSNKYLYDIVVAIMESSIMFIGVYIFSYGIGMIVNTNNRIAVNVEEAISISLLVTFSIMGIGELAIMGVSIRIVLSTMLILIASILGGASMGATSGVIVGIAFIINNITSGIYMGIFSFAGLISGAFNKINKYFCILGYILSWMMLYTYNSGVGSSLSQLRDILIASLIVIVLPEKFFNRIEKIIKTNITTNEVVYDYINRSKNMANSRLMNMNKAYNSLADTFDQIREREKVVDQRDIASIIDMIHNDQCKECSMRRRCWDLKFNHTYTLMNEILEKLEENGEITCNHISEEFIKECIKPESVVKVSNYYYKLFALDYNWNLKFSESRRLIANQIRSMSKAIEDLSQDLETNVILDLEKENEIQDYLERNNITVDKVNYITKDNDDFEIKIEKKTCNSGCMCEDKILKVLSDFMGEDISVQKTGCRSLGGKCKATLSKSQNFKIITDVASMSKDGHILCGDNYTHMDINDSKYMVAISDGMGKGTKAYEESSITIDILEKMMDAKIDDEIIINTINNMLLLKSSDEMFSTLDLGIIDLKKGMLETIKMGACSTYIKRDDDDVDLVSSSSLPVGILSDIKLDRKAVKVNKGDYIIMVSDGILDAGKNNNMGDNWLIYFLKSIDTTNPKEIANLILDRALEIQNGSVEDDMTVLVSKVCSA
ncbi:stage II sporulation protein E [Romboutsia lituseburensis]|uniref:stage II sporulation protein E n=1 Tax=Romboutsia lituseburensis TaxID=1537 RepID=UPI00215B4A25|nr:stage II sporulation protein E [Romboutsia lituseburensis]MCR8746045.1 stage II sporulation protein E [Romboutsia lituseburensis]